MKPFRATALAARRSAHRKRAAAFTAVEVLISMTIMAIGAATVMTMQKASIQGNLDARKTDVANSIARMWVERLRRDAMQWTLVAGNGGTNIISAAGAQLLSENIDTWGFPDKYAANAVPMSVGFDILGRDLPVSALGGAGVVFCTNVRLKTLTPTLIRADVRVIWPRAISSTPAGFCTAIDPLLGTGGDSQIYHAIYLTTALTVNASQAQ